MAGKVNENVPTNPLPKQARPWSHWMCDAVIRHGSFKTAQDTLWGHLITVKPSHLVHCNKNGMFVTGNVLFITFFVFKLTSCCGLTGSDVIRADCQVVLHSQHLKTCDEIDDFLTYAINIPMHD